MMQSYKEYLDQRLKDIKRLMTSVDNDDDAYMYLEDVLGKYESMTDYQQYEKMQGFLSTKVGRELSPAETDILWHSCQDPFILDGEGCKKLPRGSSKKPKIILDKSSYGLHSIMSNQEIDVWEMNDDLTEAMEYELKDFIDNVGNVYQVRADNLSTQVDVYDNDTIDAYIMQLEDAAEELID